ncbi:conserved exported protein of unknown function [Tenacibaculum sp. 190524A02b]|uniref:hypothetical protein n=1 Tax=Tenacibaculum vairaonense TaxID=3137860 RepID=UPI0032B21FFF
MKKVTLIISAIIGMLVLASCTDNTLEEVESREQQRVQFIEPGDDGTIKDSDPDDDGEG